MSCVSFRQHQSLIFFLPRQPKEHEFPMGRRCPIVTIGKCRGSGFTMSASLIGRLGSSEGASITSGLPPMNRHLR